MDCSSNEASDNEMEPNPFIDQMTLELLMNKQQYQKYKETKDPTGNHKDQEYSENLSTYKSRILDLTTHLLNDHHDPISNDVNSMFEQYSKCLIRHFKMKDIENENTMSSKYESYYDDDQVMFGEIDNEPTELSERDRDKMDILNQSVWGKSITKKD